MILHPIAPVYDSESRILILGSFPSVKSREIGFYYGHPQNRFWRVLSAVFDSPIPIFENEKRDFLLSHKVALWDVIASCEIEGSADSSIRNVLPNNLSLIVDSAPIKKIFVNGKTAERYYKRFSEPMLGRCAECLPSTSPANASWSIDKLIEAWKEIKDYI